MPVHHSKKSFAHRRAADLAGLLRVAAGNDRAAFYQARAIFTEMHGGVRESLDGALAKDYARLHLKFALTHKCAQDNMDEQIRDVLMDYTDRRRAASRHDPPPEPTA